MEMTETTRSNVGTDHEPSHISLQMKKAGTNSNQLNYLNIHPFQKGTNFFGRRTHPGKGKKSS